jgi:hypothetical protein
MARWCISEAAATGLGGISLSNGLETAALLIVIAGITSLWCGTGSCVDGRADSDHGLEDRLHAAHVQVKQLMAILQTRAACETLAQSS